MLVWRVENSEVIIVGTIHASGRSELPSFLANAIKNAKTVVFEANFFELSPNQNPAHFALPDTLSNSIPERLYLDTKRLWLEFGGKEEELQALKPWRVAVLMLFKLLKGKGLTIDEGIDRKILRVAYAERRKIEFLESPDAGFASLAGPTREQEVALERIVYQPEEALADVAAMVAANESGNPSLLLPIVERTMTISPVTWAQSLPNRNKAWIERIVRYARSKRKVVVVIGEMHMVGPDSIPELLLERGHECTLVSV